MSFLEHLEELRWRILYILIGLLIGTVIAWIFIDFFIEKILLLPANKANLKLQNLKPFGQLFLYLEVALIVGFIISIPNFFYQSWKFVAPALKRNEKKYVFSIVTFTTVCFIAGVIFAYFIMLPLALQFASEFGTQRIENDFAVNEYFSIILSVMIGAGVVFELPMLSFFLSKIGILTPKIMRKFWRHSILIIFVLSAILTPGGDPISQIILAVPLVLLYEISILISRIFSKKKEEIE
ncbi:MAG: twin-arginine translocase subunit TatC [Ignavibacteriales bacterium]|nr:twin-arginine translocase subunit TatC [Ignavibacteriales bacterium]